MVKNVVGLILITLMISKSWGEQSCSRVAYINYQEVLVDSSSSVRGDGLKFYLNRDPIAKEYLRIYQEQSKPSKSSAAISTIGVAVGLTGMLTDKEKTGVLGREFLLTAGLGILLVNFFVSKTLKHQNENNLMRAIEEYNKRNKPRIYFSPYAPGNDGKGSLGVNMGVTKSF